MTGLSAQRTAPSAALLRVTDLSGDKYLELFNKYEVISQSPFASSFSGFERSVPDAPHAGLLQSRNGDRFDRLALSGFFFLRGENFNEPEFVELAR